MKSPHFFLFCVNQQYSKIDSSPRSGLGQSTPNPQQTVTEVRNISYVNSLRFVGSFLPQYNLARPDYIYLISL